MINVSLYEPYTLLPWEWCETNSKICKKQKNVELFWLFIQQGTGIQSFKIYEVEKNWKEWNVNLAKWSMVSTNIIW